MDRQRMAVALTWLAEVHGQTLTTARLGAYLDLMAGVDVDLAEAAIRKLATEQEYFPKPATILERVRSLTRHQDTKQLDAPPMTDDERQAVQDVLDSFKQRKGWV